MQSEHILLNFVSGALNLEGNLRLKTWSKSGISSKGGRHDEDLIYRPKILENNTLSATLAARGTAVSVVDSTCL